MLKKIVFLSLFFFSSWVCAADTFVISDIRVEGLQRVSAATVFANLPFNIKDEVSPKSIRQAIGILFSSGNFTNIEIGRDGDVLVIILQERPSISEIEIEGNKAIKTEDLMDGLKRAGLAEGSVFKQATLDNIRIELQRQYVAQGRYDAEIIAEIDSLPRNRVALKIDVDEGSVAKIKHLNIVGNKKFTTEKLLNLFEIQPTGLFSWASSDDKYAKERLAGDLEKLEAFYKNQGYLKFSIDSTEVALSPEKNAVFITVNVTEDNIYHVSDVKLSGDIILPEPILNAMIQLKPDDVYSQIKITTTEELLAQVLGNEGYTFAKVRSYPVINEENNTVELTFFIDPGKRTYVNRIEFFGNTTTQDEVLRREMRQMEGAPASGQKIELSRVRLERLGYFKTVETEMQEVPGSDDLVDVAYTVEEQHSGSIGASIGFADSSGVVISANLQQNNFMGTGKKVGFGVTRNDYQTSYNFNYTNPYYTIDGVSRGFGLFYRDTDFDKFGVAEYSANSYGATLSYGYPISEESRIGFGFGYANVEITTGPYAPQEVVGGPSNSSLDNYIDLTAGSVGRVDDLLNLNIDPFTDIPQGFVDLHGNTYDNYTVNASFQQSKLNRGLLPDKGYSQSVFLEVGIPDTDLEYYKLNYDGQYFVPIAEEISIRLHTQLGYGDGYGDTETLPFFEHFFSGGFGSVRGYERSSLGPKGTPAQIYAAASGAYYYDSIARKFIVQELQTNSGAFGGNILIESGAEFIFPLWFIEDRRSLRTVLFLDSGNVFDSDCGPKQESCYNLDLQQIRASYGFGLTWISALGPLTFSLARPLNNTDNDDTKLFQFSIGTGF
jgi:outer membrane protein insertion porin family